MENTIQGNSVDQKKKKPRLKFNAGLAANQSKLEIAPNLSI